MIMKPKGVTLLELLMLIGLIGLVGGMVMAGQVAMLRSTMRSESTALAQTDAVYAAAHIYKNLFPAEHVELNNETAVAGGVDFSSEIYATVNGVNIGYKLVGTQIRFYNNCTIPIGGDGDAHMVVANNAESLIFRYDPVDSSVGNMVEIEFSMLDPEGKVDFPMEMTTAVLPRCIPAE